MWHQDQKAMVWCLLRLLSEHYSLLGRIRPKSEFRNNMRPINRAGVAWTKSDSFAFFQITSVSPVRDVLKWDELANA